MSKYLKFIIEKYKAIDQPLEVNVTNNGVYPILGINESGKTSILQGILAFVYYGDEEDSKYKHLTKVGNLYKQTKEAKVTAEIELSIETLENIIQKMNKELTNHNIIGDINKFIGERKSTGIINLCITRIINGEKSYKIKFSDTNFEVPEEVSNLLSKSIIAQLPYIFYFDDFRDRFDSEIKFSQSKNNNDIGYSSGKEISSLRRLFEEAYKDMETKVKLEDVFDMERNELSITCDVLNKKIESLLTENWSKMQQIEKSQKLEVVIRIDKQPKRIKIKKETIVTDDVDEETGEKKTEEIKTTTYTSEVVAVFSIAEEGINKTLKYFSIDERSKGFIWFFNFIFKTALNENKDIDLTNSIYLLDEPGCYLHGTAQSGLCNVLTELAKDSIVIYNTHSHHLLKEEFFPRTFIASKDNDKNITLKHFTQHERHYEALEPIKKALQVESSVLEEQINKEKYLIVEGISDFYAWHFFVSENQRKDIGIIASTGADNIEVLLNILISTKPSKKILVLFDNDDKGRSCEANLKKVNYQNNIMITSLIKYNTIEDFYDKEELNKVFLDNKLEEETKTKTQVSLLIKSHINNIQNMKNTKTNFNKYWGDHILKHFE